jgi:hypothetical protein
MTNEEHNKYIAWAFLANGIFQSAMLVFIFAIIYLVLDNEPPGRGEFPAGLFALIFGFAGLINLIFLSPNFVAAYALLKRKPWARIAGIVAAALSAMNVPLGTLAAVYSLWFFCGDQWKSVYPETAEKGRVDPLRITPAETQFEGYTKDEEGAFIYRTPPPPDWR